LTSLTPRYSAEGLDYEFQYSSERLVIDPGKLKTAKVADFTMLREAQREVKIYCHGRYQCQRGGDDARGNSLQIRNPKFETISKSRNYKFQNESVSDFCPEF
jgi:hypothetical protein